MCYSGRTSATCFADFHVSVTQARLYSDGSSESAPIDRSGDAGRSKGGAFRGVGMRQGSFERDENFSNRQVFRLKWLPEPLLSEQERQYAQFVRYLIAAGRLSDRSVTTKQ